MPPLPQGAQPPGRLLWRARGALLPATSWPAESQRSSGGQTLPEFPQWRLPAGIRVLGTRLVLTSSTAAVGLSVPGTQGGQRDNLEQGPQSSAARLSRGRELGRRGRVGPGAEASPRPAPLAAGPGGRKGPERGPTPRLPEPIAGGAERK